MVSVIMPVYNTGRYLDDSIGSVLRQKYSDLELIVIDDASEDEETKRKLIFYEEYDKRVHCVRLKHHIGAANARNRGIDKCKGDFVIFLDSDDYFDPKLIWECYVQATRFEADIVFFNYWHFDSEDIYSERYYYRNATFYEKYAQEVFDASEYDNSDLFLYGFATGTKFFRKSLIMDYDIRFQNLKRQNDIYFSLISMLYAKKSIFVNEDRVLLHARDHDMEDRISKKARPECGYLAACSVLERAKRDGILYKYSKTISRAIVHLIYNSFNQCRNDRVVGLKYYNYMKNRGIKNLYELCSVCSVDVTSSFLGLMGAFKQDYEDVWWESYSQYIWTLEMFGNVKVISELNRSDNVVVWGMGVTGRKILHFCKALGIRVCKIVDRSYLIQGTNIEGMVVESPVVLNEKCMVVTGNRDVKKSLLAAPRVEKVLLWEPSS